MLNYNPNHPIRMRLEGRIPFIFAVLLSLGGMSLNLLEAQHPPTEWFLATGNGDNDPRIFVRTIGTGPDTVILLHGGWGGEHRSLIHTTRGLEDVYTFILYDQRGSLRSPFPDSLITFEKHIQDLELLRKELGLTQLTLVGHSMRTYLASAYHHKIHKGYP